MAVGRLAFSEPSARSETEVRGKCQGRFSRRLVIASTFGAALAAVCRVPAARAEAAAMLSLRDSEGREVSFTESQLAAMPWRELATTTRWTSGVQKFRGPSLRHVLTIQHWSEEDLRGRRLRLTALNDYEVEIPADDIWDYDPILARELNGEIMTVRNRGPLWLVYPRDEHPALLSPVIDERWVWQLHRILIL